jgi:putative ABC transport system permease protein
MKKEMAGSGATVNFWLEPFADIHLHSPFDGFEPNNNIQYIFILAGVALLILVIACSTFINLSTAQSLERAKEVGIRKVIGAGRKQLFWQFIGESAALCILSLFLSLLLSLIFLPSFNQLTSKQLSARSLFSIPFLCFALIITALVSFLAGAYPAFALTRFQPVKVLKGSFKNLSSGRQLRKSLIIFQFALSVFMIIATFIIQEQLFYIQHRKLGYDRNHVLVVPADKSILPRLPLIKQEFTSNPDVFSVSSTSRSPVEGGGGYNMRSSVMPQSQQIAVTANPIDEDFVKTTGLSLIAGEDLTLQDMKDALGDSLKQPLFHFILNESAARELGWTPLQAIGKKMFLGDNRPGFVRGVVKDFNFESLHQPVKSFILFTEARENKLLLKLSGQHLTQTISFLGSKWKELVPDRPFEYRFMDEDYNNLYHAEMRLGNVMNVFSLLAIVLACLGLFGLSSYAIQQRTKEIGVRKVLGASVNNIVLLLSGGFVKLTCISLLISFPLAWWCMTKWLAGYAYRISMNWYIYLIAGAIVLLLSLCTVAFQSVKAALVNPVKNLRTE